MYFLKKIWEILNNTTILCTFGFFQAPAAEEMNFYVFLILKDTTIVCTFGFVQAPAAE